MKIVKSVLASLVLMSGLSVVAHASSMYPQELTMKVYNHLNQAVTTKISSDPNFYASGPVQIAANNSGRFTAGASTGGGGSHYLQVEVLAQNGQGDCVFVDTDGNLSILFGHGAVDCQITPHHHLAIKTTSAN